VLLWPPGSGARGGVGRRGRLTLYLTGPGQDLGLTLVAVGRTFGAGPTAEGDRGQKSHPVRRDVREGAQCCSASDCTCAGLSAVSAVSAVSPFLGHLLTSHDEHPPRDPGTFAGQLPRHTQRASGEPSTSRAILVA